MDALIAIVATIVLAWGLHQIRHNPSVLPPGDDLDDIDYIVLDAMIMDDDWD